MRLMKCPVSYYQQFDADYALDVPGEGYGGWKRAELDFDLDRTALVVMHAWAAGTRAQYPGWYRCVEYIERANAITRTVFPPLLAGARASKLKLLHVAGGGDYFKALPGYQRACELAGPEPEVRRVKPDDTLNKLHAFRGEHVFVGKHNEADVSRGFKVINFPSEARPVGDEWVVDTAGRLAAVCQREAINHLVYVGFALNWCLLMSPCGMLDMARSGVMCSTIRQATTCVESKESARGEQNKQEALWRVALEFGFVFEQDEFLSAIARA